MTVEPRRRKFHKPITLTIPVPVAASKGMINQYSGDTPTLRLLCSITGRDLSTSLAPKMATKMANTSLSQTCMYISMTWGLLNIGSKDFLRWGMNKCLGSFLTKPFWPLLGLNLHLWMVLEASLWSAQLLFCKMIGARKACSTSYLLSFDKCS